VRSGKLRHKVSLQRRVDDQEPGGQVAHSYVETAKIWAGIASLSGREFLAAQQINSEITSRIAIRFRPEVNETYRIVHTIKHDESPPWTDVYDVIAVMPDEKTGRREMSLLCAKRVAEGWRGGTEP
jgi:SPP1 family predicted phage head-tail adaptor